MNTNPTPQHPEALTVPKQGAIRGRLPRLVGLLRCAYAWEWRNRRVVVAYGRLWRDLVDGIAALLMAVVTIPVTLLRLIMSPLYWLIAPAIICLRDQEGVATLKAKWRGNKPNA